MTRQIIRSLKRLFFTLLKNPGLLRNLSFKRPAKNEIALYDGHNYKIIKDLLFEHHSISIIHTRGELICVHPSITLPMLRNLVLFQFRLQPSYTLSLLKYIQPRIVITFTDNNSVLELLFDHYPAHYFYVQNGKRNLASLNQMSRMGTFFCFGQRDVDVYKQSGIKVDQYVPCGPLLMGYYMSQRLKTKPAIKYDLCLISQYRANQFNDPNPAENFLGIMQLCEFTARLIKETKWLKLAIALVQISGQEKDEWDYFAARFDQQQVHFNRVTDQYSSYDLVMESELVLSYDSTLAFEAFGIEKKTFLFSHVENERNKTPAYHSPIFSLSSPDYEQFRDKVMKLLNMPHEQYLSETEQDRNYWISHNGGQPAHEVIQHKMNLTLKSELKP